MDQRSILYTFSIPENFPINRGASRQETLQLNKAVKAMAASRSTLLLLLLVRVSAIIPWPNKVGAATLSSSVAELQRERWREKLPQVAMPQTLVDRLSPLSITEMQNLAAGMKKMDSFDAHQFCRSAGLICSEDVDPPKRSASAFTTPSAELRAIKEHVFFDKKELRKSGRIILPDLNPPNYLISFFPRELAELMPPFSSANVSQILKLLNISKESNMSRSMAGTLEMCEKRLEEGEVKRCATSIEGMLDFVLSVLGSDVDLLTDTSVVGSGQRVTVSRASKRENMVGGKSPVTCHNFAFPYGVSYCHSIKGSEVFDLRLEVTRDREKVTRNATALCHYFSSNGTGGYEAACHPVYGEMLLWTPKPKHM